MRILQLAQKPQRRGAEVFTFQLSEWLRNAGHEVRTAYLYDYKGDRSLPLVLSDICLAGREGHIFEKFPGVDWRLLERLRSAIEDFEPEIVQANGARTVKYAAAAKRRSRFKKWHLVSRNIGSPLYWMRGLARTLYYRHLVMPYLDGIIGVSQKTLDEAFSLFQLRIPSACIPNGVDLAELDTGPSEDVRGCFATPGTSIVALFMGSLSHEKRPDRFLRVLKRAREYDPRLLGWFLGDGPERARIEELASRSGLSDYVRFLGYQERVGPFIRASDLLVITSDTEGIPAVAIEAGYLGKPVVGTSVGGVPECVKAGQTGYLFAPDDEAGLAEHIVELARDDELRSRMGISAREWILRAFNMDRIGEHYLDFYNAVLAKSGGPQRLGERAR